MSDARLTLLADGEAIAFPVSSSRPILRALSDLADDFIRGLPSKRSPRTRAHYAENVIRFVRWLEGEGVNVAGRLTPDHLRAYKALCEAQERAGKYKASSVNNHLVVVRAFVVFLIAEGAVFERTPDGAPWITETRTRAFLSDIPGSAPSVRKELAPKPDEMRRLISVIKHPRDRALFVLLIGSGLRISEALALRPCDFEFPDGDSAECAAIVHVMRGKGGKRRTVPIAAQVLRAVKIWAAKVRPKFRLGDLKDRRALWPTLAGCGEMPDGVLDRYRAYDLLNQYRRAAGIKKRFSLHNLRHYFGINSYAQFRDPVKVAEYLGHAGLGTVQVYVESVDRDKQRPFIPHL